MNGTPESGVYTENEFSVRAVSSPPTLTEGVGVSEAARRLSIPMKSLANWCAPPRKAGSKLKTVGGKAKTTD